MKLSNIRFTIRFKGNLFSHKALSAQIRFNNVRFKRELTSHKFEVKGRQKISGWKWRFRFKIRFKGKMSPTKLWSSQYPVQNPGSRRIYLLQKVKGCQRGPAAMMRGSNMGILPYWLIILLITWGLGRIRTIATPLDRCNATASLGGLVVSEP